MIKISSIDYMITSNRKVNLIGKENIKDKNIQRILSDFSLEIIDSVLQKNKTVIFSQGPLNVSMLLICMLAICKKYDILIGLPAKKFDSLYKKYKKHYFSLLFKKYIGQNKSSSDKFVYEEFILCKGRIDENTNDLASIIIETSPTYGTTSYKARYNELIKKQLSDENTYFPKIVFIPIKNSLPSSIIGEKKLDFHNETFRLNKFNPDLIILEEINERNYNLDSLVKLTNKLEETNKKILLHFSWPYISKINDFLTNKSFEKNTSIIHMGKRLCFELKEDLLRPKEAIDISIEGKMWDLYYPNTNPINNYKIISQNLDTINSLQNSFSIDNLIFDIRKELDKNKISNKIVKNYLMFPPIIDTFLSPREVKTKLFIKESQIWSFRNFKDFFDANIENDDYILFLFNSLYTELDKFRDLSYEIVGMKTNNQLNKKSILQSYFLNQIRVLYDNLECQEQKKYNYIIVNLHPNLGTRKSMISSLNFYLSNIYKLQKIAKKINVKINNNDIIVEINEKNKKILKLKVLKEKNQIELLNIDIFQKIPIKLVNKIVNKKQIIQVSLDIDIPVMSNEFIDEKFHFSKKIFTGLLLYEATIDNKRKVKEKFLQNVNFSSYIYKNTINFSLTKRILCNLSKKTEDKEFTIEIKYLDLTQTAKLSIDEIRNSKILIPGPIPYHLVSEDRIFIAKGFDTLLLPFKEILFFAYPGRNIQRIKKQIELYKQLFTQHRTKIAIKDLQFSLAFSNNSFKYLHLPNLNDDEKKIIENLDQESIIDDVFTEEFINESEIDEFNKKEIQTIKDIWQQLDSSYNYFEKIAYHDTFESDSIKRNEIYLYVTSNSKQEKLEFYEGTLLRKKIAEKYQIVPIDEISINDEILLMNTNVRDSLDNLLLRDFIQDSNISLEQILEPFICLRNFFIALKSIKKIDDIKNNEKEFSKLYWLNSEEKENLYYTIISLLNNGNDNYFWENISSNIIMECSKKVKSKITYGSLFPIIKDIGFSLAENTFKSYCSSAVSDQKHYYFRNDLDLEAIGKFILNKNIIENYQIINEMGNKIGVILQIIGRSIARVLSGKGDSLNEIDLRIEGNLRKCKVIKITNT